MRVGFLFSLHFQKKRCPKVKQSSSGWEPSGATALCIFAGGDGDCVIHTHIHTLAHTYIYTHGRHKCTRGGAHAPIICTLQIYNTTIHIRRSPVGAETQEGRAPLSANAWPQPMRLSECSPPSSYRFPPLQGDAERRNARESYLSRIPCTCEL